MLTAMETKRKIDLGLCPYCQLYGLVTTMRFAPGGFVASGKCSVCGYTCDSGHAARDASDDLPCESLVAVESGALD